MATKYVNRFNSDQLLGLYRSSPWRAILQKEKQKEPVTLEDLGDDYYRGKTLGYFKDKDLIKIRKRLKVISQFPDSSTRMDYFTIFHHDINRFIPVESLCLFLYDLIQSDGFRYLYQNDSEVRIVLDNLVHFRDFYANGQVERFADPLENYLWISQSFEFFKKIMIRNLPNGETSHLVKCILANLRELCQGIYSVGLAHRFKEFGDNLDE